MKYRWAGQQDNTNLWRTTGDTSNTFTSMIGTANLNDNATKVVASRPGTPPENAALFHSTTARM